MAKDVEQENIYERKTKVIKRRGGIWLHDIQYNFFHSPCGGEVDIFMFSVINSQYTKEYNINFC